MKDTILMNHQMDTIDGIAVAGRQGGEERFMSATVKQRKTRVGECYLETRGGSPCPRG
jgi:hypothetical protein